MADPPTTTADDDDTDNWVLPQQGQGASASGDGGGDSSGDSGGGFLSGVSHGISLLGNALGGGDTGLYPLTPQQQSSAGARALLNFGMGMLASSGYSPVPRTFGQVFASGLSAAEKSRAGSEQAAFTQAGQQQARDLAQGKLALERGQLGVAQGSLTVQQQEALIKLQQFQLQQQMFQQRQKALGNILGSLGGGGQGGGGQGGQGGNGQAGQGGGTKGAGLGPEFMQPLNATPAYAALPTPTGDMANNGIAGFKSPALASQIVQEAENQGVDPRIALSVAYHESGGDPNVGTGDGGLAVGPFQVHPDAAQSAGFSPADRSDVGKNVAMGVTLLKNSIGKYGPVGGIAGYRLPADAASAASGGKITPATGQYVSNVLAGVAHMPALPAGGPQPYQTASLAPVGPPGTAPAPGPVTATPLPAPSLPVPPIPPPGGPPAPGTAMPPPGAVAPPAPAPAPGVPGPQTGAAFPGGGGPGPAVTPPAFPTQSRGLDPDLQQQERLALAAEMSKPDGGSPNQVLADFQRIQDERDKVEKFRPMTPQEAIGAFGQQAYNPKNVYFVNQFGKPDVIQQQDPTQEAITKQAMDTINNTYEKGATEARSKLDLLDSLGTLNQIISTDPLGKGSMTQPFRQQLSTLANSVGIQLDTSQAMTAADAYNAIVNQLTLSSRPAGVSRLTNMDIGLLKDAVPTLVMTPQGRNTLNALLGQFAQRQIDQAKVAENTFYAPGPNHGTLAGLQDKLDAMGPVIPRAPQIGTATNSQLQSFAGGLKPGQVYVDPWGKPQIRGQEIRPAAPPAAPAAAPPVTPGG